MTHFSKRLVGGPVAFTDNNSQAAAYDTFEEALDAANAAGGGTITLGDDVTVTIDALDELLAVNKDIKLNGEGSLTIKAEGDALKAEAAKEKALLTINNGGKLTIDGVTVNIFGAVVTEEPINYNNIAVCMFQLAEQGIEVLVADGLFKNSQDRKSTRLNSSHSDRSRMPSSA